MRGWTRTASGAGSTHDRADADRLERVEGPVDPGLVQAAPGEREPGRRLSRVFEPDEVEFPVTDGACDHVVGRPEGQPELAHERVSELSVAVEPPAAATAAIRSAWNCAVPTAPARTRTDRRVSSTPRQSWGLSSCRSRLYACGNPFTIPSAAASAPATVDALARTSSIVSGFFFCGMIEEVEQYASSRTTNPTSGEDQSTSSSASRLAPDIRTAPAESASRAKSRPETASMEFSRTPEKPSRDAVHSRSSGYPVEANAAEPSGQRFVRA